MLKRDNKFIKGEGRYLSVRIVKISAMVEMVTAREDEFIYATVSFLK